MNGDSVFVDTNVLTYAHDTEAGERHRRAAEIVSELWVARTGVLSVQVLQERHAKDSCATATGNC